MFSVALFTVALPLFEPAVHQLTDQWERDYAEWYEQVYKVSSQSHSHFFEPAGNQLIDQWERDYAE